MVAKTGREGEWEMASNGYRFYFWSDKNVPELDSGDRGTYFFLICICLFVCLYLRWVFIAVHRLSLVAVSGGYSSLRCTDFSLW